MTIPLLLLLLLYLYLSPASSVLTRTYITYLFESYGSALAAHRPLLRDLCADGVDVRVDSLFAELVYLQLRESRVCSALEVAAGDEFGFVTAWTLLALRDNNNDNNYNKRKCSLWTIAHNDSSASSLIPHFLRQRLDNSVDWTFTDVNEFSGNKLAEMFPLRFNETSPLDALLFSTHQSPDFSTAFLLDLLDPYVSRRDPVLPAVVLMFYTHEIPGVLGVKPKRRRLNVKELTRQRNKNIDFSLLRKSSVMLEYFQQAKTFKPIDINLFGPEAIKVLKELRGITNTESSCHSREVEGAHNSFAYVSILNSPRLSIITPAGRPHLLLEAIKSIRFEFVREWIIVHDHKGPANISIFHNQHPKITELYNPNPGVYGNSERNFGMDSIPNNRKGWVYFLDDDNYMHNNIWTLMSQLPLKNLIFTGQIQGCPNNEHTPYFPSKCQVYHVDTGVGFFNRPILIGAKWNPDRHEADGLFYQEICSYNEDKLTFTKLVASYHNGQYCPTIEKELD